jgi:hypothetical protein
VGVTLANAVTQGFAPQVFFNGLQVRSITYTAGSPEVGFTVPYATEAEDHIAVTYNWR